MKEIKSDLPLIPLRDVVVFPGIVTTLFVGRPKSIEALNIAMSSNKKLVLVSDIGGMKELVEDGKTGLLFKSDSVEEIEKIILKVIEMQGFDCLIDNAFHYVLNKRNWKKNVEAYNRIYLTLING